MRQIRGALLIAPSLRPPPSRETFVQDRAWNSRSPNDIVRSPNDIVRSP